MWVKHQLSRALRWPALVVCTLLLVAWGISTSWGFAYDGVWWHLSVRDGRMTVRSHQYTGAAEDVAGHIGVLQARTRSRWRTDVASMPPHETGSFLPSISHTTRPVMTRGSARRVVVTRKSTALVVPLWLGPFLCSLATIVFFRRARRPPRGRCVECGYDLQGNISGVCPECGTRI